MEGIDIESEEAPEVLTQVLDVLRQYLNNGEPGIDSLADSDAPLAKAVCNEILVRVSTAPKCFSALKDAATVMVTAGAEDRALQVSYLTCSLLRSEVLPPLIPPTFFLLLWISHQYIGSKESGIPLRVVTPNLVNICCLVYGLLSFH